jgi:hypothetical protein
MAYQAAAGFLPAAEALDKSCAAAKRAHELSNTEALADTALGLCALQRDWDWAAAETAYEKNVRVAEKNLQRQQKALNSSISGAEAQLTEADEATLRAESFETALRHSDGRALAVEAVARAPADADARARAARPAWRRSCIAPRAAADAGASLIAGDQGWPTGRSRGWL